VVYSNVLGPKVSSWYVKRPRDDLRPGESLTTTVVAHVRIPSLIDSGKSLPAMTRQPGWREGVAKRRRPKVTNVALPPMTLRRAGLLGILISSRITMPKDTHDMSSSEVEPVVDIVALPVEEE
jgi:hypothetical protein